MQDLFDGINELGSEAEKALEDCSKAVDYMVQGGQKIASAMDSNDPMGVAYGEMTLEFGREKLTQARQKLDTAFNKKNRLEKDLLEFVKQ